MDSKQTREREIRALEAAMLECKLLQGTIVTLDHKETVKIKRGIIEIIPAWQWVWLLSTPRK